LYENSTIYFADLVGFTAWSAKRTPEEVFQLLESLYSVFDDIATKRSVYKIETIGDCYVAATGLPEPQEDHAVIMCKFATDCRSKFAILTANLADTLGEDTASLAMRIGIHRYYFVVCFCYIPLFFFSLFEILFCFVFDVHVSLLFCVTSCLLTINELLDTR